MSAYLMKRSLTSTVCRGNTHHNSERHMCLQRCHPECAPLAGITIIWTVIKKQKTLFAIFIVMVLAALVTICHGNVSCEMT